MKLTTVTVSFGRTQSLPEYSNVMPSITLTAELGDGDDPATVAAVLLVEARAFVEGAIDDALEDAGEPAKFSTEPRYQIWSSYRGVQGLAGPKPEPPEAVVVVVPQAVSIQSVPGYSRASYSGSSHLRFATALRKAQEIATNEGRRLIDCADGDLARIPRPPTAEPAPQLAPDDF